MTDHHQSDNLNLWPALEEEKHRDDLRQKATRAWALKHLDLDEDYTPQQVQRAFLRKIQRDAFLPPPATDFAFRVLGGCLSMSAAEPSRQRARAELECVLRKEVDAFAMRFFDLAPAERHCMWTDLWLRCAATPFLTAHLAFLRPALDLAQISADESPCGRMMKMVCELFVLRPLEYTRRRRQLIEDLSEEMAFWKSTAQEFRKRFPALADLEPQFIGHFADRARHAGRVFMAKFKLQWAKMRGNKRVNEVKVLVTFVICVIGAAILIGFLVAIWAEIFKNRLNPFQIHVNNND